MNYSAFIGILLVATLLLFGCTGAQTKANVPEVGKNVDTGGSSETETPVTSGQAGSETETQGEFNELDSFVSSDLEVADPGAGVSDFSLDESEFQ